MLAVWYGIVHLQNNVALKVAIGLVAAPSRWRWAWA